MHLSNILDCRRGFIRLKLSPPNSVFSRTSPPAPWFAVNFNLQKRIQCQSQSTVFLIILILLLLLSNVSIFVILLQSVNSCVLVPLIPWLEWNRFKNKEAILNSYNDSVSRFVPIYSFLRGRAWFMLKWSCHFSIQD